MLAKPFLASSWITKAPSDADPKDPETPWDFYAPPALMDTPDYDRQTLVKAGVLNGLKMWERLGGHFDYAHQYRKTQDPKFLIAVRKGMADVNGVPNVIGELYKDEEKPLAKSVWSHLRAGGPIGLSIEGIVKALDPKDKSRVLDTEIHFITIDPAPKGFDGTRMRPGLPPSYTELTKSLTAELEQGDVRGWYDVASLELEPITNEGIDPYAIWTPHTFLKALTAGDASGGFPTGQPGDTGFRATIPEEILGAKNRGSRPAAKAPQARCAGCGTKNLLTRKRCRECGKPMVLD